MALKPSWGQDLPRVCDPGAEVGEIRGQGMAEAGLRVRRVFWYIGAFWVSGALASVLSSIGVVFYGHKWLFSARTGHLSVRVKSQIPLTYHPVPDIAYMDVGNER